MDFPKAFLPQRTDFFFFPCSAVAMPLARNANKTANHSFLVYDKLIKVVTSDELGLFVGEKERRANERARGVSYRSFDENIELFIPFLAMPPTTTFHWQFYSRQITLLITTSNLESSPSERERKEKKRMNIHVRELFKRGLRLGFSLLRLCPTELNMNKQFTSFIHNLTGPLWSIFSSALLWNPYGEHIE